MDQLLSLFVKAVFIENMALSFFLGMCMFLAVSRRVETAIGMGAAVFVVMTLSVPLNNLIFANLLRAGACGCAGLAVDLTSLSLFSFIGCIRATV